MVVEKLGMYLEKFELLKDLMLVEDICFDLSMSSIKSWKGMNSFYL